LYYSDSSYRPPGGEALVVLEGKNSILQGPWAPYCERDERWQGHLNGLAESANFPVPRCFRFGVTAAGLVFTHEPAVVEHAPRTLDLLRELQGPSRLVVRLNRLYWSGGEATIEALRAESYRYAREGFDISLQLRYGGPNDHLPEGGPDGFAAWTRRVVRTVAQNNRVIGLEITNEPNLEIAPDNSDGAFERVGEALVAATIAAYEEARHTDTRAEIGFNWFHDTGQDAEEAFWERLGALGGGPFASSLDWVGLNVYPGTYDFSDIKPGQEGAEMERALMSLRNGRLPMIGVPATTPIRVTEFGWPNGAGRTEQQQADNLATMIAAAQRVREQCNVTDLYWFNLRDSDSSRPKNESHYGLTRSDYAKKAAFEVFKEFVHSEASIEQH
jgi:hypothetical protein